MKKSHFSPRPSKHKLPHKVEEVPTPTIPPTQANPPPPPPFPPAAPSQGPISVMCVAVAISTVIIIVAASVILSVTLTYSLKAADEFATSYSQNSVSAAMNKVNDFVKYPLNAYCELGDSAELGYVPNMLTAVSVLDRQSALSAWQARQQPMIYSSEFSLLHMGVGFDDGTWTDCAAVDKTTTERLCTLSNPLNTSLPPGDMQRDLYSYVGQGLVSHTTDVWQYDPRIRPWYLGAPKARGSIPIFSSVYVDFDFRVPVVDVNGPLFAKDGSFIGVTSISLDLRQIATFLANMPRTTNGMSALVDAEGFMLGASDKAALSTTEDYNVSLFGPLPLGCDQFTDTTDGSVSKVCRLTPATYSSPILQELAAKESGVFAYDGMSFTRKINLHGEQWMVSKAPITAKTEVVEATISWQIFTLMPVSDVTGPIIVGQNAGIAVACVMVVVSCLASGISLFILLNPLSILSNLMERAAELKDDSLGTTMDKSSMREIRAIQDSFERLSAQLKKAKSFLPASILAQLESSSEGDDEAEEGEVTRGATSVSGATTQQDVKTSLSSTYRKLQQGTDNSASYAASSTVASKKVISSDISLIQRNVTVAVVNLRNFHRNTMDRSSGLEASYGKLVDEFQRIAKEHRGIMDSFHGDRFTFTFNTVRPCATHASTAATAMLKIVASMGSNSNESTSVLNSSVTCGVATGRCLIGNLGSDAAKRYTVIGPAFSHATVLERLCKRYPNTSVLLSAETSKDCETHIGLLYMDVIESAGRKMIPIASAKYLKGTARRSRCDDEWMYEMDSHEARCDYHSGNRAFLYAINGDSASSTSHLAAFKVDSEECDWVRNRIADFNSARRATDLGLFYDRCVLGGASKSVWEIKHDDSVN